MARVSACVEMAQRPRRPRRPPPSQRAWSRPRRMLTASPSNGRWRNRAARRAGKPGRGAAGLGAARPRSPVTAPGGPRVGPCLAPSPPLPLPLACIPSLAILLALPIPRQPFSLLPSCPFVLSQPPSFPYSKRATPSKTRDCSLCSHHGNHSAWRSLHAVLLTAEGSAGLCRTRVCGMPPLTLPLAVPPSCKDRSPLTGLGVTRDGRGPCS